MLIDFKLLAEKDRKGNLIGDKFGLHIIIVESPEGFVCR